MTVGTLSRERCAQLDAALQGLTAQCGARAAMVCDTDGNILSQAPEGTELPTDTIAVLAAGTFVATRELATTIGEPGFRYSCHRGTDAGVLVYALGPNHIILVVLGRQSVEGLVRICLEKVAVHLRQILVAEPEQPAADGGEAPRFEVREIT